MSIIDSQNNKDAIIWIRSRMKKMMTTMMMTEETTQARMVRQRQVTIVMGVVEMMKSFLIIIHMAMILHRLIPLVHSSQPLKSWRDWKRRAMMMTTKIMKKTMKKDLERRYLVMIVSILKTYNKPFQQRQVHRNFHQIVKTKMKIRMKRKRKRKLSHWKRMCREVVEVYDLTISHTNTRLNHKGYGNIRKMCTINNSRKQHKAPTHSRT